MISKEEIVKALKVVTNDVCNKCYFPKKRICRSCIKENRKLLKEYIQQEETKNKKVIDYLEKEKYTIESTYSQISGNYFMAQDRLDLINRVLEIMKGEE